MYLILFDAGFTSSWFILNRNTAYNNTILTSNLHLQRMEYGPEKYYKTPLEYLVQ